MSSSASPLSTLYRAIVSSARHDCECIVFFEHSGRDGSDRLDHLEQLMCRAWDTEPDDLDIYNILSERELVEEWSCGGERTGDLRLFETGCWFSKPTYANSSRTLIFVSPATRTRLEAALVLLPAPLELAA